MKKFLGLGVWCCGMVVTGMYLERNKLIPEDQGWPSCCSADEKSLVGSLRDLVGSDNVLIGKDATVYTKGARMGQGKALAVIRPGSFQEASKSEEHTSEIQSQF